LIGQAAGGLVFMVVGLWVAARSGSIRPISRAPDAFAPHRRLQQVTGQRHW